MIKASTSPRGGGGGKKKQKRRRGGGGEKKKKTSPFYIYIYIYFLPVTNLTARKIGRILNIPIYATTQNRDKLGETCAELGLEDVVECADKTLFSMWVPEIQRHFRASDGPHEIAIVGIGKQQAKKFIAFPQFFFFF